MSIKKILIILLIIALGFSIYGCKAIDVMKGLVSDDEPDVEIVSSDDEDLEVTSDVNIRDTVLYFQNANGYLVPMKREIPWEEGIAKAALRNMVDSPMISEDLAKIGLMPVIPTGTEIIGMSINEGLCKVDFTKDILNYNNENEEVNMVRGIVYTLTEFPAIDKVQFMIEGKIIDSLQYGTQIGKAIVREDINLLGSASAEQSKVVVYYKEIGNGEYEYYVPVTVPISNQDSKVSAALRQLFEGVPQLSELYTDIPFGVSLNNVEVREGIALVNLALETEDAISSQREFDMMEKNIGLTLGEIEEIVDIEILIDGKDIEEAGLDFFESDGIPVFANEY